MTTNPNQIWAHGATPPATPPTGPPNPTHPMHFPPTGGGSGLSGPGTKRGFARWIVGAVVLVAVAAAGVAGGWALRGATTSQTSATPPQQTTPSGTGPNLTPDAARKQTCDAYLALGTQWSRAYHAWLPSVSGTNWHWDDPAVTDATKTFAATQTQIVTQLRSLIVPGTPSDVTTAVYNYTAAILSLGAGLGNASGPDTNTRIDAVDAASAAGNKACGV